jgi:N-carbamoyl-L-amino-acid hydrolase
MMIDEQRLARELDELGAISSEPSPVVTRVVFTEADLRARTFLKHLCAQVGLEIREDAIGNTFARWQGADPALPAVGTGSHIDAIPNAGRFDGTVGVLGGLEAIRALQAEGLKPRRSIELLIFTSEEPTRFGVGCIGSRLLCGSLNTDLKDAQGKSLDEVRQAAGFKGPLNSVPLTPGYYSAFVELHIEQGPLLEQHGIDLGIVTAIAAPASLRIFIDGEGGHAGAMLMPQRHDALCAASELILEIEAAAFSTNSIDTVATTGICQVFPGAVNSVPSRVRLEVDVRDIDEYRRDQVLSQIKESSNRIAERRQVSIKIEPINADPPATCAPEIIDALAQSASKHKVSYEKMISRAYHDSLFMSRIVPTAMLFIPSKHGISHRPDEYSSPEQIAKGALILAETLKLLSA